MFKVNNKDNDVVLLYLLLTLNIFCTCVSVVNFEQVNPGWIIPENKYLILDVYFENTSQPTSCESAPYTSP